MCSRFVQYDDYNHCPFLLYSVGMVLTYFLASMWLQEWFWLQVSSQFGVVKFKEALSLLVSDEEKDVLFLDLLEETWNFPAGLDVEWNVGHQGQREMVWIRGFVQENLLTWKICMWEVDGCGFLSWFWFVSFTALWEFWCLDCRWRVWGPVALIFVSHGHFILVQLGLNAMLGW